MERSVVLSLSQDIRTLLHWLNFYVICKVFVKNCSLQVLMPFVMPFSFHENLLTYPAFLPNGSTDFLSFNLVKAKYRFAILLKIDRTNMTQTKSAVSSKALCEWDVFWTSKSGEISGKHDLNGL